jgi:hypothetical protein
MRRVRLAREEGDVRTLAIIALIFWMLGSVVFADWKRHVAYPKRTFAVGFTTSLYELAFVALGIWVIVRG